MALKPTIFKFNIALADLDNHHYPNLQLTLAQHPSESQERMVARLLAFCIHSHKDSDELMCFSKGLSDADEPAIWRKGYDEQIQEWIDVGEPSYDRLKKACRQANETFVYSFNTKSDVWFRQTSALFSELALHILSFDWLQIKALANELERTPSWSITISEGTISVSTASAQIDLSVTALQ
ncbi:YaeQ family protein [Glaciecola sp. MH2013]|uniref:YaeQ family protein n=1 Tax=Glaciecola sp. MH2013 TaxID=2785524 RepID=UPI00189C8982|nr:YaeQ family protein [Glaciecola sp. MH2013]MBF7073172.1 YaeQ family protein [Glaciecola sp. MH2013]